MKKPLLIIVAVCGAAYLGLVSLGTSEGREIEYHVYRDSAVTVVALPPADFAPAAIELTRAPKLRCNAALVLDNQTNQILLDKSARQKRSIASITKLLAAIVLVDMNFDFTQSITIAKWDAANSASSHLRVGETFYAKDLFYAALVCSDNRAIKALARSSGLTLPEFVQKMNDLARALGMDSTEAVDPSGIFKENCSSAVDCARLLNQALKKPLIRSALSCKQYEFRSLKQKRLHRVNNTNRLLESPWQVAGGKTGYIAASGYCFAVRLRDSSGSDITTVVLGSPSNRSRFSETTKIATWAFQNLGRHAAAGVK